MKIPFPVHACSCGAFDYELAFAPGQFGTSVRVVVQDGLRVCTATWICTRCGNSTYCSMPEKLEDS